MATESRIRDTVQSSQNGLLIFYLEPSPCDAWTADFLELWKYCRQKAEGTLEPLGEAEINGMEIRIQSPRLFSERWQSIEVQKVVNRVNQDVRGGII